MGGEGGRTHLKTVLVVDDERSLRLLCRVNLELEGHRVLEAATLAEARALDRAGIAGRRSCWTSTSATRTGWSCSTSSRRSTLPSRVVLLSGTSEIGPELRARVAGVIGKPFDLERLSAAVSGATLR